jgi:hypothetical protein
MHAASLRFLLGKDPQCIWLAIKSVVEPRPRGSANSRTTSAPKGPPPKACRYSCYEFDIYLPVHNY